MQHAPETTEATDAIEAGHRYTDATNFTKVKQASDVSLFSFTAVRFSTELFIPCVRIQYFPNVVGRTG